LTHNARRVILPGNGPQLTPSQPLSTRVNDLKVPELAAEVPEIKTPRGHKTIYVFALP